MEEPKSQFDGMKYRGFKLINLKLTGLKLFGDIEYNFVDELDKQDKIYSTVIIGPNGTKKSLLFNLIIFIFKSISDLKNNKEIKYEEYSKYSSGLYQITYSLNNNIYDFWRYSDPKEDDTRFSYGFKINGSDLINGKRVAITDFELPLSIVANSINITDKFQIFKEGEFPRYHYLGIKYSHQAASTKSYLKKVISDVAKLTSNRAFLKGIHSIAQNFIGDGKTIFITYKTSEHNTFFSGNLDKKKLDNYFEDLRTKYKLSGKTPPFRLNNYDAINNKSENSLSELIAYSNKLDTEKQLCRRKGQSTNRTLVFDLGNNDDLEKLKSKSQILNQLSLIGLLKDINIEIGINLIQGYSLEDSSSGEHNIITSLVGLMATYKVESLLLIDEPEISLHPNWQMKYVSFLKKLFASEIYHSSHIIIATHSHFIVSDLEGDSSKVIGLAKNDGLKVVEMSTGLNTYGWTADEVLYRIFGLRTTRNHFFEYDITMLATLIQNKSEDSEKIAKILEKLGRYEFSKTDPLTHLIEMGKKLIKGQL